MAGRKVDVTIYESDWVFAREALPLLRDYLLSREVYWPMRQPARSPNGLQVPPLTIGSLQLSLRRLSVLSLEGAASADLENLRRGVLEVRHDWRANWGNKAAKESESRLHLWQQYISELRADPRGQAAFYASEVRNRVILRLLQDEINGEIPSDQAGERILLDQILRGISRPGPFVWEAAVQPGFDPEDFWFLYVTF